MRPEDLAVVIPEGERTDAEGQALQLEAYEGRQVILNQAAAEALGALPGDKINLYVGSTPRAFTVAAVASAGRSPRAVLDLRQAQALLGQRGKINAIMISNQGDQRQGARLSDQVTSSAARTTDG